MAANAKEKEPVNIVHRNAIFCETIQKEQRHQKLYTNYGVNPYKKSKSALFAIGLCCSPSPFPEDKTFTCTLSTFLAGFHILLYLRCSARDCR